MLASQQVGGASCQDCLFWIWAGAWQNQQNNLYAQPKTQINLVICPVWSESSLSAWRCFEFLATHQVHSEDSGQSRQMPRLSCVFAGHTGHYVCFIMLGLICQLSSELEWLGHILISHLLCCPDSLYGVWHMQLVRGMTFVRKIFAWLWHIYTFEPEHDKTNKMTCAPGEDRSTWVSAHLISLCLLYG